MKRRLVQSLRDFRPGSSGVLVLAFLLLPYFVDVAYYGDFTATHFAQKNSTDGEDGEEDLSADGRGSPFFADDQAHSGVEVGLSPLDSYTQCSAPTSAVLPPHYLFVASLTSRPPPTL